MTLISDVNGISDLFYCVQVFFSIHCNICSKIILTTFRKYNVRHLSRTSVKTQFFLSSINAGTDNEPNIWPVVNPKSAFWHSIALFTNTWQPFGGSMLTTNFCLISCK